MLILALIWAVGANWLAYKKGFFELPKGASKAPLHVLTKQLLCTFGIYLSLAMLIAPVFARMLLWTLNKANPEITTLPITLLTGIQFLVMVVIFLLLQLYMYTQDAKLFGGIWKSHEIQPSRPTEFDFGLGAMTWFIAFPMATVVGELVDKLMQSLFGITHYEQTAVQFVKAAAGAPFALIFAFISVLVLAPLIEEFLFRGILQTYLKKRLGAVSAILLSALTFGLFHFSPGQGMGNVSLIIALFILGCFLGFLYERQKSLWASIGLHMTFNAISALRIVFFPEAG